MKAIKMSFEVVYDSIKRLTVMFESVVSITEIGNISFTEEGMLISTMDTSHVSFIRLWLDKDDFSKYNIENGEKVIGVSFKDIAKILKSLSTQNSSVTFRHTEALDTVLEIEVNDGFKHKFTSKLLDIDSDTLNIPDLDFDIECDFSGNFYMKIMDSVAVTESDVVVIGSKDNELKIKAKGDNTEMEISLSKENNTETRTSIQKVDGKNKLVKTKQLLYTLHQCKETFEAEFALRYLKQFTKPISIVDKIGFYVSPEMPMKLEFMINDKNGSLIEYFIAPKISDV